MKKLHFLLALAVVCASALVVGSYDNSSKAIAGENGHIKVGENGHIKVNVDRDKGPTTLRVEGCKKQTNGGEACVNVSTDFGGNSSVGFTWDF